jgi:hypothetical protein
MALAAAIKGGLRPSQIVTWSRDDGDAEQLTGATLTGTITNRATGTTRAIAGTLTVTDGAAGQFRWDYVAGDVSDAGEYDVQFSAAFASGQTPARTFIARWTVRDYRTVTA